MHRVLEVHILIGTGIACCSSDTGQEPIVYCPNNLQTWDNCCGVPQSENISSKLWLAS